MTAMVPPGLLLPLAAGVPAWLHTSRHKAQLLALHVCNYDATPWSQSVMGWERAVQCDVSTLYKHSRGR